MAPEKSKYPEGNLAIANGVQSEEEVDEEEEQKSYNQLLADLEAILERGELPSLVELDAVASHEDHTGFTKSTLAKIYNGKNFESHFSIQNSNLFKTFLELSVPSEVVDSNFLDECLVWILRHDIWCKAKTKRLAVPFLKWIKYLIQYSLCPFKPILHVYEPLMLLMSHLRETRPLVSEILVSVTKESDITRSRVNSLEKIYKESNASEHSREKKALVNLVEKFKYLKPNIIPKSLSKFKRSSTRSTNTFNTDVMAKNFDSIWRDRNPIDTDLDQLALDCKLTWENDEVFDRNTSAFDGQPPKAKRQKLLQVLPYPEPNPISPDKNRTKSHPLFQCGLVSDVYANLLHISLPAQTLALLNNRGTFLLLIANKNPRGTMTRLSLTLYSTLYNEFFGSTDSGSEQRRRFILQRISRLQDFFQEGIPVVARFLTEYLVDWDGKEFFMEIMGLLAYIQITDFEELQECVLNRLIHHFAVTFTFAQRLFFVIYLNKLITHWINLEYERSSSSNNTNKRFFGSSNPNCTSPLEPLHCLLEKWVGVVAMGFAQLCDHNSKVKNVDKLVYVNEVLTMILLTSRLLIEKNIPLRLELPKSIVYFSLFHSTPVFLSRILEHITSTKHETIPLCKKFYKQILEEEEEEAGDDSMERSRNKKRFNVEERAIISRQFNNKENLNTITKDILSVLSCQPGYLERDRSIFRQDWEIDEDKIRQNLKLTSHPAFLSFILEFVEGKHLENPTKKRCQIFKSMQSQSEKYDEFLEFLSEHLPRIGDFFFTFQARAKNQLRPDVTKPNSGTAITGTSYPQSQISHKSVGGSTATSGISSMQPTVRRSGRQKRKLI